MVRLPGQVGSLAGLLSCAAHMHDVISFECKVVRAHELQGMLVTPRLELQRKQPTLQHR